MCCTRILQQTTFLLLIVHFLWGTLWVDLFGFYLAKSTMLCLHDDHQIGTRSIGKFVAHLLYNCVQFAVQAHEKALLFNTHGPL